MLASLDAWIRRRGVCHEAMVPVLRNQLVLLLLVLTGGTALAGARGAWVAAGFAIMTFVLFSWARLFSRVPLVPYGPGLVMSAVLRFILRLTLLAAVLFVCLVPGHADPFCLTAGVVAGSLAPLGTLAFRAGRR